MKHTETVIIGGGQAGLAISYYLSREGHDHLVLEKGSQPAPVWRNQRWDSFTLVTPNWAFQMPGADYGEANPDGYLSRSEVVHCFDQYVNRNSLPVEYNTYVESVETHNGNGYHVKTPAGVLTAKNVVVATGFFQKPKIPASAANIPGHIIQLHSSEYRNPASLPPGAVLVVGSAQSGCQIAEELNLQGRKVFLGIGRAGRAPRRYRGKDIIWWLNETGFFDLTPEQLPPGMGKFGGIPHLSGTMGGHTINLHQFARHGVTLLGHYQSAQGSTISFGPDMYQCLTIADKFEAGVMNMIDDFVRSKGLSAPLEKPEQLTDGFNQPVQTQLDLAIENIQSIIWATGYHFDYSMVKLPVHDNDGFPLQNGGVTRFPGLYFIGLPWMPSQKSGFLIGVNESAQRIAGSICKSANVKMS